MPDANRVPLHAMCAHVHMQTHTCDTHIHIQRLLFFFIGVCKMTQQLRSPAAFPEDWGLISSTHVAAHNYLKSSSRDPQAAYVLSTDIHRQNTHKIRGKAL